MTATAETVDPWADVVGQPDAVAQLRAAVDSPVHAYLFLGPHGSGKRIAARAFAAALLAAGLDTDRAERTRRLAVDETHPDLVVIEPIGRTLRIEEADLVTREASRSPIESGRKVLVVDRFHTAEPIAAASLLKTIEEPPATAIFIVLAESIPPEHITIASRCITVPFAPVPLDDVVDWLQRQGADSESAAVAAEAARGDMTRARLLVTDPAVAHRRTAWASVINRLDGTGYAVTELVIELTTLIDEAQAPLDARHADDLEALAAREDALGTRGSGRKDLEARHKRETRKLRQDELLFGFATIAAEYRAQLLAHPSPRLVRSIARLREAAEALDRNVNETLLLQALFLDLPVLR